MRFSLVYLFGKFEVPETMRRAMRYVPPAVLSAIVVPELLIHSNGFDLSLQNTRWLAGACAVLTKNTLLTILAGMLALPLLQVM